MKKLGHAQSAVIQRLWQGNLAILENSISDVQDQNGVGIEDAISKAVEAIEG